MPYSEAMIKRQLHGFGRKSLTQEEFIKKAINIHGNKYDYSKVIYEPAIVINGKQKRTKICIICPEHGEFYQSPQNHLYGKGCLSCSGLKRLSKEDFIEKVKKIHGDKYNYSNVVYNNSHTKICIICPVHGQFYQRPIGHLVGNGCPKCSTDKQRLKLKDFIDKAIIVHGDKFNYSKVDFSPANKKICIICKKHGEFFQKPHSHLKGNGCPHCMASKGEVAIKDWLVGHNICFYPQHKFDDLRGSNQIPLEFDFYIPSKNLLIEFDGRQHFEPVQFNGIPLKNAIDYLNRAQYLDKVKDNYCKNKSIPLLRISYKDKEKIPDILMSVLKE